MPLYGFFHLPGLSRPQQRWPFLVHRTPLPFFRFCPIRATIWRTYPRLCYKYNSDQQLYSRSMKITSGLCQVSRFDRHRSTNQAVFVRVMSGVWNQVDRFWGDACTGLESSTKDLDNCPLLKNALQNRPNDTVRSDPSPFRAKRELSTVDPFAAASISDASVQVTSLMYNSAPAYCHINRVLEFTVTLEV
jgi:hypothetical protein